MLVQPFRQSPRAAKRPFVIRLLLPPNLLSARARIVAVLCLSLVLTACRSSNAILDQLDAERDQLPFVTVCANLSSLDMVDARVGVDSTEISLPRLVYTPGDIRSAQPPILPEREAEIRAMVGERFRADGPAHTVIVRVVEGQQEFYGGWKSARQTVRWAIEVEIESPSYVTSARGSREVLRESATSARDFLRKATSAALLLAAEATLNDALGQMPADETDCSSGGDV